MSDTAVATASLDLDAALGRTATGDLFFMNRKCLAMKDPLGIGLCLLTKTENRFDHVGMIVKLQPKDLERHYTEAGKKIAKVSPSGTYVMETNMKGVTLLAAEDRIGRSSAHEIVVRPLRVGSEETHCKAATRMLKELESMYAIPYQNDVWCIVPSIFSPPDKMDRIDAAHKIHQLEHEIQLIDQATGAANGSVSQEHMLPYQQLRDVYKNSQRFLAQTYFPHLSLGKQSPDNFCSPDEWRSHHFWFDGANQASRMVCSELICNLWQRTGLLNGFTPASSNRPFDLLDDTRLNFLGDRAGFAPLAPLKVTSKSKRFWDDANVNRGLPTPLACVAEPTAPAASLVAREADFEAHRLSFINDIRAHHHLTALDSIEEASETAKVGALLPFRWLVQSTWAKQVEGELPYRLAGAGVLFSLCTLATAPLSLRWIESQCGLFLVRGSMWTLASGVLARNLTFSAAQGLFAWTALQLVSDSPASHAPKSVFHGQKSSSTLVDTRHPYYTVVGTMAASAVGAHVVTAPIMNSTISYHFGPLRPGPLPMRLLCRGCLSLAPVAMLLPFQAYWLSWYETGGSFIIPIRSSVLRARADLLQDVRWPHFRNDALVGCLAFVCVFDALFYPLRTMNIRRLMKGLYAPQASPSFGPRLYPGYRYRALSNALVFGLSTAFLHLVSLI